MVMEAVSATKYHDKQDLSWLTHSPLAYGTINLQVDFSKKYKL